MTARNQASLNRFACLLLATLAILGCVQSVLAEDPAPAVVDHKLSLKIELLEKAVPSAQPVGLETHAASTDTIELALGDPLGLRIALKNEGEVATEPMPASLNPLWMPAVVVIVHPDGHSTRSSIGDPRQIRVPPTIRPIDAGEQLEADVCAYTDNASEISSYRGEPLEYLFPNPGQYDVYVAYFTRIPKQSGGAGEEFGDPVLNRIHRRDGVLLSNTVRVNVGPAFSGWEELREAGLIRALRFGYWESPHFADEGGRAKIDALVEQSDREWLKVWYSKVEKRPPFRPTMP